MPKVFEELKNEYKDNKKLGRIYEIKDSIDIQIQNM
jgi:hypothetical protein